MKTQNRPRSYRWPSSVDRPGADSIRCRLRSIPVGIVIQLSSSYYIITYYFPQYNSGVRHAIDDQHEEEMEDLVLPTMDCSQHTLPRGNQHISQKERGLVRYKFFQGFLLFDELSLLSYIS